MQAFFAGKTGFFLQQGYYLQPIQKGRQQLLRNTARNSILTLFIIRKLDETKEFQI